MMMLAELRSAMPELKTVRWQPQGFRRIANRPGQLNRTSAFPSRAA
jgi:hypothetical protein